MAEPPRTGVAGGLPEPEEPAGYVVRVRGVLGPVLLASLPRHVVERVHVESRSVVITELSDTDVVDVVQRLVEHGLEIESVREIDPPPTTSTS